MKNGIKKVVDIILTVLLLLLMAYQVTEEALHEWFGVGMTVILILHHILNLKWYATLFKGRYNAYRIATVLCNTLLLAAIGLTAFCGMSMSNHAVPFLYGMASMIFVRQTHLAMSFWSFILMGLHLGLHLPALTARVKPGKAVRIIVTVLFTGLAGVGFRLFLKNGIPNYIFWRTPFAFLDYEKAPVLVFLENLAMLFFFAFVGANLFRVLRGKKKPTQALVAVLCILLAVGIGFGLQARFPGETEAFPDWGTPSWEVPPQTEAAQIQPSDSEAQPTEAASGAPEETELSPPVQSETETPETEAASEAQAETEPSLPEESETETPTAEPQSVFEWETDDPEKHGLSAETVNGLNDRFARTEITSCIIVKDGVIVNEYYKDGYDAESIFPIHSCSKSITSAIFGIARDDGLFPDLNETIADYFPELNESDSAWKKEITVRHLLTHTSGLRSTENRWYEWRAASNWLEDVLEGPMYYQPGTVFDYSTGNTHLLSAIVQKATGETLYAYGKEHLFDRIGMESIRCGTDAQGISDGGNGFTLTARDMARFGLLYLNHGKWRDEQIISEDWIEQSTTTQFDNSNRADYGYQWWVRTFGSAGYPAYFAQGHGCQFIFVIPDLDLVITFTSNYYDNSQSADFWQYVTDIAENASP